MLLIVFDKVLQSFLHGTVHVIMILSNWPNSVHVEDIWVAPPSIIF